MKQILLIMCFWVSLSFSQKSEYKFSIELMQKNLYLDTISIDITSIDKISLELPNVKKNVRFIVIKEYEDAIVYYAFNEKIIDELEIGERVAQGDCLIVYLKNIRKYCIITYFSSFYIAKKEVKLLQLTINLSFEHLYNSFVFFDEYFSLDNLIRIESSNMIMVDKNLEPNKSYFSIVNCEQSSKFNFVENYLFQKRNFADIIESLYKNNNLISIRNCMNEVYKRVILPEWVVR